MKISMPPRKLRVLLALSFTAIVSACSGGGSSASGVSSAGTASTGVSVSITPSLGKINNADVAIKKADGSVLATLNMGSLGSVTFSDLPANSPLLVEVKGTASATYYDEARNTNPAFDTSMTLRAAFITPAAGGSMNVGVTPLTDVAVARLIGANLAQTEANITNVNAAVGSAFSVPNILLAPRSVASSADLHALNDDTTIGAGRYALKLAALAKMALAQNSALTAPAATLMATLSQDMNDGKLDGKNGSAALSSPPYAAASFAADWKTAAIAVATANTNTNFSNFLLNSNFVAIATILAAADTTPPVVTAPANITTAATGSSGSIVTFPPATAIDDVSGVVTAFCTPASGATFPIGTTTVTCTANDVASNVGSASFTVTVSDTTPPVVTVPANIITGSSTVTYLAATATDLISGNVATTCTPASGSTFSIGMTTVTCTAKDAANNTGSASFTVTVTLTVNDTTPPVVTVPANIIAGVGLNGTTAAVSFTATATDLVSGSVTPICTPASGSTFNMGVTTVKCNATDAAGNKSSDSSFTVTVVDRCSANAMAQYICGMAVNQWKLWTTGSDGGFGSALLPRTRANFDGNGTGANGTFATDAAVAANPMTGVGGAAGIWAYSSPAINTYNGDVLMRGGGHTNGGDGSIYGLNLFAGPGASWALKVSSERYIPASEPKPAWSHSRAPLKSGSAIASGTSGASTITTTAIVAVLANGNYIYAGVGGGIPTGTKVISGAGTINLVLSKPLIADLTDATVTWSDGYWAVENKNGVKLPTAVHAYYGNVFGANSDVLYLSSPNGFYSVAGSNTMGDTYAYQPSLGTNDGIIGPFYISASLTVSPFNSDSSYSYAQPNAFGLAGPICSNDLDGKIYTYGKNNTMGNTYLWRVENALTAPSYSVVAQASTNSYDVSTDVTNCVIFPDPIKGSNKRAFFAKAVNGGTNRYVLFDDITGTSTFHGMTWPNGFPTTLSYKRSFAWNKDLNVMAMTDGVDIWEFSFDLSGVASAFTQINAGATGDIPTSSTDDYHYPRLEYFAAPYYAYVLCNYKQCSVFRRQ